MRVIVVTIAGLSLVAGAAAAQPPARAERAATLKMPVAIPEDHQPVARGVADGFPPSGTALPSTAIQRGGPAAGPAWLSGVDPNLLPAGGAAPGGSVRVLTPPARDDAGAPPRLLDRARTPAGERQLPHKMAQAQPPMPTASTPFRGTGANGAPVYAGPPAYRWYGWGTVTPGANPLAPAGQYPKASANWYSITGATPGAFPVPVTNAPSVAPGTEPPNYGLARSVPAPHMPAPVVEQSLPQPRPQPQPAFQPKPASVPQAMPAQAPRPQSQAQPESKFLPGTSLGSGLPAPVTVPTLTAPTSPKPVVVAPPLPLPRPSTVALKPVAAPPVAPLPVQPVPVPVPVAVAVAHPLPALPAIPALPSVDVAKPALPAIPAVEPKPLPTSVRTEAPRDLPRWQPATEPSTPPPGTWAPAHGLEPLPTVQTEEVGSVRSRPVVARGQAADSGPDPVAALIKQVCRGRADGVEVRWTGTKKLQVCFEVATAAQAQRLVADISKRPELTAYQIDYCVLVK